MSQNAKFEAAAAKAWALVRSAAHSLNRALLEPQLLEHELLDREWEEQVFQPRDVLGRRPRPYPEENR